VTVTATVPVPAGEEAVIEPELTTVTPVAGTEPKSTIAPLMKPVPLMVTLVPPAAGPVSGLTAVTVGLLPVLPVLVYVKSSEDEVVDVPAVVITVTSTVPVPAGEEAVTEVGLTTVTPVACTEPKSTVAPVKNPVPLIVTLVPPAAGPLSGLTAVTVGALAGAVLTVIMNAHVPALPSVLVSVPEIQ
jgi:hypothetical protein